MHRKLEENDSIIKYMNKMYLCSQICLQTVAHRTSTPFATRTSKIYGSLGTEAHCANTYSWFYPLPGVRNCADTISVVDVWLKQKGSLRSKEEKTFIKLWRNEAFSSCRSHWKHWKANGSFVCIFHILFIVPVAVRLSIKWLNYMLIPTSWKSNGEQHD